MKGDWIRAMWFRGGPSTRSGVSRGGRLSKWPSFKLANLSTRNVALLQCKSVEVINEPQAVYNLEIAGQHVFRIGKTGVLVNNVDPYEGVANGSALTVFDPVFAARQTLKGGRVHVDDLKRLVPNGTPNTFVPSSTIADGRKFKFQVNGAKVEIKWHSPDAIAAANFPVTNKRCQVPFVVRFVFVG